MSYKDRIKPNNREMVINRIVHLVDILGIKKLSSWPEVNFLKISSIRNQNNLTNNILLSLLEELESTLVKRRIDENVLNANPSLYSNNSINKSEKVSYVNEETTIIAKQDFSIVQEQTLPLNKGKETKMISSTSCKGSNENNNSFISENIHGNWKESIPRGIKNSTDWELYTINMASLFCKEILIYTMGRTKNEIETFLKGLEGFQDLEAKQVISNFRKPEQEWRNSIPELIKYLVNDWDSISSDQLKSEVLDIIDQSKGIAVYLFEDYLGIIEDLEMGSETYEEDYFDNLMYNSLEIVEKYKDGAVRIPEEDRTESTDESWRKMVPFVLKKQVKDWKTDSILDVYNQAKEIMRRSKGEEWEEIVEFVTEMSQIIFVKETEEDSIEDDYQSTDEIAESIMSLVEMIILPRLEVLDILKEKGGNVIFGNLWNVPFPESLTTEVKDRDNWKCVICENETDLHVHHKIPRNLGGIHHIDNLVTLCASCHGAIETADINHAFTKCLANYKKQKFSKGRKFDEITKDKKLLKAEIENSLDKLLIDLNKRDELKLMEDVIGIMKRIEIVFYG